MNKKMQLVKLAIVIPIGLTVAIAATAILLPVGIIRTMRKKKDERSS